MCTATSLNFTSYGRAERIANGEGAVSGGRRELEQPFSFEKKRLKYASRPRSRLSAPLGGTEVVMMTNIHKDSEHRTPMNVLHQMNVHGAQKPFVLECTGFGRRGEGLTALRTAPHEGCRQGTSLL